MVNYIETFQTLKSDLEREQHALLGMIIYCYANPLASKDH